MTKIFSRKSLLIFLLCYCHHFSSAQTVNSFAKKYNLTVTLGGGFAPTAKPDASSFELPVAFGVELMRRFPFASTGVGMQVGLGVQQYSAVSDYYFNAGDFVPLQSGTNYNRISQTHLQVPVMLEMMPLQSTKGGIAIVLALCLMYFWGAIITFKQKAIPESKR